MAVTIISSPYIQSQNLHFGGTISSITSLENLMFSMEQGFQGQIRKFEEEIL